MTINRLLITAVVIEKRPVPDAAYGAGELLAEFAEADVTVMCKVQSPNAPGGRFTKDCFDIDVQAGTVTCPAGVTVEFGKRSHQRHAATARFGGACGGCDLAAQCTSSAAGRSITITAHEEHLAQARTRQQHPDGRPITAPPDRRLNARSAT